MRREPASFKAKRNSPPDKPSMVLGKLPVRMIASPSGSISTSVRRDCDVFLRVNVFPFDHSICHGTLGSLIASMAWATLSLAASASVRDRLASIACHMETDIAPKLTTIVTIWKTSINSTPESTSNGLPTPTEKTVKKGNQK